MNKKGLETIEESYGLRKFLDFLERSMGGHGNGYALVKDGKAIDLRKGVYLKNSTIARTALKTDFDWFVYHTRLASCGSIKDANCHPFQNPFNGDILAANGTEYDLIEYNHQCGLTRTDTETLLLDFLRDENFLADCRVSHSTLIGIHKGKAFAIRNQGSLKRLQLGKDSVVLASQFPAPLDIIAYPTAAYFEPNFEAATNRHVC
jgi:hypothetical protein